MFATQFIDSPQNKSGFVITTVFFSMLNSRQGHSLSHIIFSMFSSPLLIYSKIFYSLWCNLKSNFTAITLKQRSCLFLPLFRKSRGAINVIQQMQRSVSAKSKKICLLCWAENSAFSDFSDCSEFLLVSYYCAV